LKKETDWLRGRSERANEQANALQQANNARSSGCFGKMFSGLGDVIDGAGGVVLGGGALTSTFTQFSKIYKRRTMTHLVVEVILRDCLS
jgi:hypothetical protein